MKSVKILALLVLSLVIATAVVYAVTQGSAELTSIKLGRPIKYTLSWNSDSNGAVAYTTTEYIRGKILRVVFTSGSGATDAYDVALTDDNSIDVLAGLGANVTTNANVTRTPAMQITDSTTTNVIPMVVNDLLDLAVANAGSNKTGSVILYVE